MPRPKTTPPRMADLPDDPLSGRHERMETEVRRVLTQLLVAERTLAQLEVARAAKAEAAQVPRINAAKAVVALASRHLGGMKQAFRALGLGGQVDTYLRHLRPYLAAHGYGPVRSG